MSLFFVSPRYGQGNTVFPMYKFRTMKQGNHVIEDMKDDDRVTWIGKIIRPLHLDELPQIVNVLKGDMAIVGPRPMPILQEMTTTPNWTIRQSVKPGIAGMAQVYAPKLSSYRTKFRLDALYVKRKSLKLDIALFWAMVWKAIALNRWKVLTVWTVLALIIAWLPIPENSLPNQGHTLIHLFGFFLTGILGFVVGDPTKPYSTRVLSAVSLGTFLAIVTEIGQPFVAGESYFWGISQTDIVRDIVGVLFGCLIMLAINEKTIYRLGRLE